VEKGMTWLRCKKRIDCCGCDFRGRSILIWNQFIGVTMLLYGLINPIGVIPIFSHLLGKAELRHVPLRCRNAQKMGRLTPIPRGL
jgi:hypothetical protein